MTQALWRIRGHCDSGDWFRLYISYSLGFLYALAKNRKYAFLFVQCGVTDVFMYSIGPDSGDLPLTLFYFILLVTFPYTVQSTE